MTQQPSRSGRVTDRETAIETGDGGTAALVASLVVVALIAVGVLFFVDASHSSGQTITLGVPAATGKVVAAAK